MKEDSTQKSTRNLTSTREEPCSFADKLSLFLAGFQLSDILTTKNHSDDFKDTRSVFIVRRLKLMSVVFAILIALSSVFDFVLLSAEQAQQMMYSRLGLATLLVVLTMACYKRNNKFAVRYFLPLGFLLPIGFFVLSQLILGIESSSLEAAGYSYFPYLIVGMLALFPLTIVQSLYIISLIFIPFIMIESMQGAFSLLVIFNKVWAFSMFAAVTVWLQSGQLVMLLKLYRESTLDPLTGLINRRVLMKHLTKAIEHQDDFYILMFDLDKFKKINDTYGHMDGDLVLKAMATILKKSIQHKDIIARFGGEEFVAVLSNTDDAQAINVAEQIRQACENSMVINKDGVHIQVTTSIGVTQHNLDDNVEVTFNRADELLYQAKSAGRNQVIFG